MGAQCLGMLEDLQPQHLCPLPDTGNLHDVVHTQHGTGLAPAGVPHPGTTSIYSGALSGRGQGEVWECAVPTVRAAFGSIHPWEDTAVTPTGTFLEPARARSDGYVPTRALIPLLCRRCFLRFSMLRSGYCTLALALLPLGIQWKRYAWPSAASQCPRAP